MTNDSFCPFKQIDLELKTSRPCHNFEVQLPLLYKQSPAIEYGKYKNLIDLLKFIPPISQSLYKNINHEAKPTTGKSRQNKKLKDTEADETLNIGLGLESEYDLIS